MIIRRFEEQVEKGPDKLAIKTREASFTYRELNQRANQVARAIEEKWPRNAGSNCLGLFFDKAIEMIAAVIGVLKTGKVYVPLAPDYPAARLADMVSHSGVSMILTGFTREQTAGKLTPAKDVVILEPDDIKDFPLNPGKKPGKNRDKLMYILYTSGSSGKPKGVMQNMDNVWHFIRCYTEKLAITGAEHMTFFSSFSHDAAVMDLYGALLNGALLYPLDIMNLSALSSLSPWLVNEGITIWHSVPTVYRYFVNTLNGTAFFPALRWIVLGGEAVIKHDIDMFYQFFPRTALYNLYGQTESTYNSGMCIHRDNQVHQVTLGEPVDETNIFVVDQQGNSTQLLETGEIIIASPYVSPGYWKNEQATRQSFQESKKFGKLYRTGDMGCRLLDGTIKFTGRKDQQVKVRGYRIEIGEIESRLMAHEKIKEAVVITVVDAAADTYLCAYITAAEELPPTELREYLSGFLPGYMIPLYFIRLEKIPLTPNGKLDRKVLYSARTGIPLKKAAVPVTLTQKKLQNLWADLLNLEKDNIGLDSNFFELGGHSLKAMLLVTRIHKELEVNIPLAVVFSTPNLRGLALYIEGAVKDRWVSLRPAEKKEYYPLSSAQVRLYIIQEMDENTIGYNMTRSVILEGDIRREKLEMAFRQLTRRHEVLRTSIQTKGADPAQIIHQQVELNLEYYETGEETARQIARDFIRPFDLRKPPFFRVALIKVAEKKHVLLMDVHHLITDAISNTIFISDLTALYGGEALPGLRLQYKDYSEWQNSEEGQKNLAKQEIYWLRQFAGEIPELNLPTDFPRSEKRDFRGKVVDFTPGPEISEQVRELSKETGATIYMILLSVYTMLLSRYTRQEDIVVGTPVSARSHIDLQKIMGIFVNMLAMRNYPSGHKTYREFLQEVKENALKAYENQDYPFNQLAMKLGRQGSMNRNPLFDTVFQLNPETHPDSGNKTGAGKKTNAGDNRNNLEVSPYDLEDIGSVFDLILVSREIQQEIGLSLVYPTQLFKKETAEELSAHFLEILGQVLRDHDIKLMDISITHTLAKIKSRALQDARDGEEAFTF
jgi:tyrocidine synthetase-3